MASHLFSRPLITAQLPQGGAEPSGLGFLAPTEWGRGVEVRRTETERGFFTCPSVILGLVPRIYPRRRVPEGIAPTFVANRHLTADPRDKPEDDGIES
jgi:hypothetical protein